MGDSKEMVETGEIDHNGKKVMVSRSQVKDRMTRLAGGIKVDFEEAKRRGIGAITGISLDSRESKYGVDKKVIDPNLLWEKSRFQGGGIMSVVDEPNLNNMQDMDELELEEEQAEVELNDEEAPFLAG